MHRNGIECSLANKYYSGSKLEKEVKSIISSMVSVPDFSELLKQKVDRETDIDTLRKKQTAVEGEIRKYNGNLLQIEKRLVELDADEKYYTQKVDSLNHVLDELYEKINDAQNRLDDICNEITMAEKSVLTKQSVYEMLAGFSEFYDRIGPEEKSQSCAQSFHISRYIKISARTAIGSKKSTFLSLLHMMERPERYLSEVMTIKMRA